MKTNEYKLRFTVQQNEHDSSEWVISVEGIAIASDESEEKAWAWIERTWAPFPGDTVKEFHELLERQVKDAKIILRAQFVRDPYFEVARSFQRIADLANAGLRVALLARGAK